MISLAGALPECLVVLQVSHFVVCSCSTILDQTTHDLTCQRLHTHSPTTGKHHTNSFPGHRSRTQRTSSSTSYRGFAFERTIASDNFSQTRISPWFSLQPTRSNLTFWLFRRAGIMNPVRNKCSNLCSPRLVAAYANCAAAKYCMRRHQ